MWVRKVVGPVRDCTTSLTLGQPGQTSSLNRITRMDGWTGEPVSQKVSNVSIKIVRTMCWIKISTKAKDKIVKQNNSRRLSGCNHRLLVCTVNWMEHVCRECHSRMQVCVF